MVKRLAQLALLLSVIGWASRSSIGDASWAAQSYAVTLSTHVSALGQSLTGSTDLILQHDCYCTLTVSVALAGNEAVSLNGQAITTSYELTGPSLPAGGDATWVPSGNFVGRSYLISTYGPVDSMTLHVKVDVSSTHPPESGTYSAALIMTVSW